MLNSAVSVDVQSTLIAVYELPHSLKFHVSLKWTGNNAQIMLLTLCDNMGNCKQRPMNETAVMDWK